MPELEKIGAGTENDQVSAEEQTPVDAEVSEIVRILVSTYGPDIGFFHEAVLRNWSVQRVAEDSTDRQVVVDEVVRRIKNRVNE